MVNSLANRKFPCSKIPVVDQIVTLELLKKLTFMLACDHQKYLKAKISDLQYSDMYTVDSGC